jgi:hypothetical protein
MTGLLVAETAMSIIIDSAAYSQAWKMLGKSLKLLHEIGAIGTLGSFASCTVLLATAPKAPAAYAAVLGGISAITQWMLVPSLALVLISGLLAIAANAAYKNAAWAWVKALLGVSTFEGTLLAVDGNARHAAELSALAASSHGDTIELARVLHTEWGGLLVLMSLALVNIVLAVWRPRLYRQKGL